VDRGLRVAVIGAGMGGLAAAVDLAARGHRVTLLEQHAGPGGKIREARVGDAPIDSGPTVFTMRRVFDELFAHAGASFEERVDLAASDRLARHAWPGGSRLDLFRDLDRSSEAITDFAGPTEADAYRRFAAESQRMYETLDDTFMRRERPGMVELALSMGLLGMPKIAATRPFSTLWKALGQRFGDPRLRQLFGRYATYCGSSPFSAPATLMLIAHAERMGVWLVRGGMQRLAEALADLAAEHRADLRYHTRVERIETRNGRAAAVHLGDGERLAVDAVVFNGDVQALSAGLLGADVRGAIPERRGEARSLSAITWSVLGEAHGFELDHHTVFFGDDYPDEFASIFERREITAEPTVYLCAQDRGPGRTRDNADPAGAERLFALINAPPRRFSESELQDLEGRVFERLARLGLELRVNGHERRVTAPQHYAERFPGSDGAIYGWPTHGATGSFKRWGARSRVPGLYLAGGTVHPGPGVPMVAMSGRLAAARLHADLAGA
jgi:1-hydroxycarotenoid 3,4-desaturase